MHTDVADLRDFYGSPLGQVARRLLTHRIRARWRTAKGKTLLGLGFATPFLGTYREEALRIGALMPSGQGALVWPRQGDVLSVLCEEKRLPIPDASVDLLLAVHCLEVTERTGHLLREIWRVLAPQGRVMLVVPNRRGLWARLDTTPFGQGRPFSRGQLERLLTGALFTPLGWGGALHFPPFDREIVLRSSTAWERLGSSISPAFAGVLIVEAQKELVAPIGTAKAKLAGRLVTIRN